MRKIINFTHATLDGYIDNPQDWWLPYVDEDLKAYELDMHLAADAILLGRVTYEGMAHAWPNMGDHPVDHPVGGFVDHVNSITHYVVASKPVDTTRWDPTVVIPGVDLIKEVQQIKQAEGGDILIWGTGQLTDALAGAGLLDEYRISCAPVIKGGGERLFRPASTGTLKLLDTRVFESGAVIHTYQPLQPSGPTNPAP
jgi:dihydrofolate reductase